MDLDGPCERLRATGTVARRAGMALRGPLRVAKARDGGCELYGTVDGLSGGRWFVYAEARDEAVEVEAWLPVAPGRTETQRRPLYAPPMAADAGTRNAAGSALLVVCAALLVACLRLARRSGGQLPSAAVA